MKKVKLIAKRGGIIVESMIPRYKYHLQAKGQELLVPEEHAKKLLLNDNLFEEADKKKKKKQVDDELDLDGDGKFTKKDKSIAGRVLGKELPESEK